MAALEMRRVPVEGARRKASLKRGGKWSRAEMSDLELDDTEPDERILMIEVVLRRKAEGPARNENLRARREFAIALFEFRRGDFNISLEWLDRCLASPAENQARTAIALAVRAMVCEHQARHAEARQNLAEA